MLNYRTYVACLKKYGSSVINVKGSHILGVSPGGAGRHTQNVGIFPLKPEEPEIFHHMDCCASFARNNNPSFADIFYLFGGLVTIIRDWDLELTIDHVLRAQGADPAIVSTRNPAIVEVANRAMEIGLPLVEPVLAYETFRIKSIGHERITLSGGKILTGKVVANTLGPAERVIVMVGTIGSGLETLSSSILQKDPVLGLALDGLGSASVEALVEAACARFAKEAEAESLKASIPLNPGIETWPLDKGQQQIFALLDPALVGIEVTSGGMMYPQKSLSAVIGIGEEVETEGRVCNYCSLRETCRYQDQYA